MSSLPSGIGAGRLPPMAANAVASPRQINYRENRHNQAAGRRIFGRATMVGRLRRQFVLLGLALAAGVVVGAAGTLAADTIAVRINHAGPDGIAHTEHP